MSKTTKSREDSPPSFTAGELGHFRVLREFREALADAQSMVEPHPSFLDLRHKLELGDLVERRLKEVSERSTSKPVDGKARQVIEWMAHDGSCFPALERMSWALYGSGPKGNSKGGETSSIISCRGRHPG